jgi:hypothetical protein
MMNSRSAGKERHFAPFLRMKMGFRPLMNSPGQEMIRRRLIIVPWDSLSRIRTAPPRPLHWGSRRLASAVGAFKFGNCPIVMPWRTIRSALKIN